MSRLLSGGPIRVGDRTTKGGTVIGPGVVFMPIDDTPVVTRGMYAQCCGGLQVFVEGCQAVKVHGQGLVLQGHRLSCGCQAISSCAMQYRVEDRLPPTFFSRASAPMAVADGGAALPPLRSTGMHEGIPMFAEPVVANTVTVHLGLFFDGTNNNAPNTELGAQCRAEVRDEADAAMAEDYCKSYMGRGSYLGAETNVAKLYDLFRDNAFEPLPEGEREYFIRRYIDGIGTTTGEPDSVVRGQAMGRGAAGVKQRAEQVLDETVKAALDDFAAANRDVLIQSLVLHVFGFSRGAAAARHFVALVHRRGIDLCDPLANCKAHYVPGFHPGRDVRIAFVGLFDTVVNVGLDAGSGDPAVARRHGLEIGLPEGSAERIVQLCARDEHRMNFPLTLAGPPHSDLRLLPGAHSDIGGGYAEDGIEELMMIRPLSYEEPLGRDPARSRAHREAQRALSRWQDYIDPADAEARLEVDSRVQIYHRRDRRTGSAVGQPRQRVYATVRLRRLVSAAYAGVCLRVMHALATDAGVPWRQSPDDVPALSLPDDLKPISEKLIAHARNGGDPGLTAEEERLLRRRYLHLSAHWNLEVLPRLGPGAYPEVVYINRPTEDRVRVVYANTGGRVA